MATKTMTVADAAARSEQRKAQERENSRKMFDDLVQLVRRRGGGVEPSKFDHIETILKTLGRTWDDLKGAVNKLLERDKIQAVADTRDEHQERLGIVEPKITAMDERHAGELAALEVRHAKERRPLEVDRNAAYDAREKAEAAQRKLDALDYVPPPRTGWRPGQPVPGPSTGELPNAALLAAIGEASERVEALAWQADAVGPSRSSLNQAETKLHDLTYRGFRLGLVKTVYRPQGFRGNNDTLQEIRPRAVSCPGPSVGGVNAAGR